LFWCPCPRPRRTPFRAAPLLGASVILPAHSCEMPL
jgi:hypothetical protein